MKDKFEFDIQHSVQWYEGQLLYPHHYQQFRHEIQQMALCYLSLSCPFYWGVNFLEIDQAVIPNGIIRINKVLAIFPDGAILKIDISEGSSPIELDVSSLMKEETKKKGLLVYLAVTKRQTDTSNSTGDSSRYFTIETPPILEENTGESPLIMTKLALRAFITTEDKLSNHLSYFPFAKIAVQDGAFHLKDFTPPTCRINRNGFIGTKLKNLIVKTRHQISSLSVRLQSVKTKETSALLDHYQKIYSILTRRIFILEGLYESEALHPYDIYKELVISAGVYCDLSKGQEPPPTFPAYNHNNLTSTFDPILDYIIGTIDSLKQPGVSVAFDQDGRLFYQKIKASYLTQESLIVGIYLGTNISASEGSSWIRGAVISCNSAIKEIKEKRILGAQREVIEQIPEMGLAASHNQIFIKIKVDPSFIKPEESLNIFNPSDKEDKRPEDLFLYVVGKE